MPSDDTSFALLQKTTRGQAVFTKALIKKGAIIIEFTGQLFHYKDLPSPYNEIQDHYLQIADSLYMGPSGSYDDYINHSCSPNSGLLFNKNKIFLMAMTEIKKDEEITWDYSTTMDEDDWEMDCRCKNKICRGKIKDFKYLPSQIQEKYIRKGIVAPYILEKYYSGRKFVSL